MPAPAPAVADTLLEHVRDAVDEAGDTDAVTELLGAVLTRGNGAAFQRSDDPRRWPAATSHDLAEYERCPLRGLARG